MYAVPDYAFAAPLAAFVVSSIVLVLLLARPDLIVDNPNERSLHQRPVPRTGGIAIVLGALGASAAMLPAGRVLMASALTLALVSLLDDWRRLSALPRFAAHLLVATAFITMGMGQLTAAESVFLVLTLVWLANLYNFMDGADGLAGGMAVFGFAAYAAGAWLGGHPVLALLSAAIAAAALPFLFCNFHPARIFMGDVGAVTLGYLAAAIGAAGWREGTWPPLFPVLVFSPFIVDASLTLLRRVMRREKFWQPHREHYYQKLVRMGLGHRDTALAYYAAMALSGLSAVATFRLGIAAQLAAVLSWIAVLLALAFAIERRWRRQTQP
jgi:UDP-N-acetylmuramyl pentapeptide phosphotransferase/UDP-N-acetylglucosamine-1-phosphate transferase